MDSKACVLFVDDETNILRSIRREFFDAPLTVLTADSASEALNIMQKTAVDLIVSDVKMPVMDGISLLEQIKQKYPNVHRVILSGYVEQNSVVTAIVTGVASSYIAKPWKAEELRANIEQILRLKRILNNSTLMNALASIERLPSLPSVYHDFIQAIE